MQTEWSLETFECGGGEPTCYFFLKNISRATKTSAILSDSSDPRKFQTSEAACAARTSVRGVRGSAIVSDSAALTKFREPIRSRNLRATTRLESQCCGAAAGSRRRCSSRATRSMLT